MSRQGTVRISTTNHRNQDFKEDGQWPEEGMECVKLGVAGPWTASPVSVEETSLVREYDERLFEFPTYEHLFLDQGLLNDAEKARHKLMDLVHDFKQAAASGAEKDLEFEVLSKEMCQASTIKADSDHQWQEFVERLVQKQVEEIERLKIVVEEERRLRVIAERRCDDLHRQLKETEGERETSDRRWHQLLSVEKAVARAAQADADRLLEEVQTLKRQATEKSLVAPIHEKVSDSDLQKRRAVEEEAAREAELERERLEAEKAQKAERERKLHEEELRRQREEAIAQKAEADRQFELLSRKLKQAEEEIEKAHWNEGQIGDDAEKEAERKMDEVTRELRILQEVAGTMDDGRLRELEEELNRLKNKSKRERLKELVTDTWKGFKGMIWK